MIADGQVYVTVAAGSATVLYGLDPVSGNTVWQAAIPGQLPVSSPAYDDGQLFVVNLSGLVEAFDAGTGAPHWSTQLPREWIFPWPPVAAGGMVFIGGQGSAGQIYAVKEKNGGIAWQSFVNDAGTPVAYGKLVAIASPCEQYYGFAARSGEWLWSDESLSSSGGGFTPVYYDGQLFVRDDCFGFENQVLNAKTGVTRGSFKAVLAPSFFTLGGSDYIVALADGKLSATAVGSASPLWIFRGDKQLSTAPLVVNTYVVEGSASGKLYVLNEADGTKVASYDVGAAIEAPQEGGYDQPLTGLGAADGVLIVPAGSQLVAFAPR